MIELPIRIAAPDVSHLDALASGTQLGEFEILGLIGVGGFGMVYRAYDHSLQRDVAIKEYMPSALASRSGDVLNISVRTSQDEETFQAGLQSFVGEARMLARFDHPSLVKVFRFWEANNTAYMVMPLYRGMTLKQARRRMRMPPTEAWLRKVLWSILGALRVLHRGTALHRDISPDNIFLQDVGPPVLLDLGAARIAIGDRARQHTAILKVNFAPIEQYADSKDLPQGPWTDLYSLAAVVHGLLCNEAPTPSTVRVVNDTMPRFDKIATTIGAEFGQRYSSEFVNAMAWAFDIRPQDRPQSVREFAQALGLAAPNGMSSFDWRAELGSTCLPDGEVLLLPDSSRISDQTVADTTQRDYLPTQRVKSAPAAHGTGRPQNEAQTILLKPLNPDKKRAQQGARASRRGAPARSANPAPRRAYGPWLVMLSLLMVVPVLAVWGWRGGSTPTPVMATPAPDVAAPLLASAAGPALVPLAPAPSIASPAASSPGPVAASIGASAPPSAGKPAVSNRRKPTPEARADTSRPATPAEPSPGPVTAQAPSPEPAPKANTVSQTAEQLCADSNFLTRPMCLYRACQKPGLAASATCIEFEQNLKRNAASNHR
jgi:serine/threonine protein kinase